MRVAVFHGPGDLRLEDHDEPAPGPGDVVVTVAACGICGSDLHGYAKGSFVTPGQVMGHEFTGTVLTVGDDVEGVAVGDRVTASPVAACGTCPRCLEGRTNLCPTAWTTGIAYGRPGAFAERVLIPSAVVGQNVFPLSESVSDEAGALVEPLAVAVHAVRLTGDLTGRTAVVLGLGTIGQLVIQVLKDAGAHRVLGADLSELRLDVAASMGAEPVRGSADLDAALQAAAGDDEIDVVFECSGVPALNDAALRNVRGGGTIIVIALYDDPVTYDPGVLVTRELRMLGTVAYTSKDFSEAVSLLESGVVQTEPLVTHREALEDIGGAFATQLDKDRSLKVLITPNAG